MNDVAVINKNKLRYQRVLATSPLVALERELKKSKQLLELYKKEMEANHER